MADKRPFLVLTAILDASARPAAVTRSHGESFERAYSSSQGKDIAGLDVVELPLSPQSFAGLRRQLQMPEDVVAVYDVFPLSSHLTPDVRKVAGQFLAAEILWTFDEQGLLGGVPLSLRLDIPPGWDRDPKAVHTRLMEAGALDLDDAAIETFKAVKTAWDASAPKP